VVRQWRDGVGTGENDFAEMVRMVGVVVVRIMFCLFVGNFSFLFCFVRIFLFEVCVVFGDVVVFVVGYCWVLCGVRVCMCGM